MHRLPTAFAEATKSFTYFFSFKTTNKIKLKNKTNKKDTGKCLLRGFDLHINQFNFDQLGHMK